jgi:hypothetical protein
MEVEHDQPAILEDRPEARAQMRVQFGVVVEPPEAGPAEGDVLRTCVPQPLKLGDPGRAVRRRAPVLPIALQKRDRTATGAESRAEALLIDCYALRQDPPPGSRRWDYDEVIQRYNGETQWRSYCTQDDWPVRMPARILAAVSVIEPFLSAEFTPKQIVRIVLERQGSAS